MCRWGGILAALVLLSGSMLGGACGPAPASTSTAPASSAAASAATASAAAPAEPFTVAPRTIRIAITSEGLQFLPLRMAVVEGFFARHGLEGALHRIDANAGHAGLFAGQFDYIASFSRVIHSSMRGLPMNCVAALVDRPLHVLVAVPEMKSVAELRGKNIATRSPGGVEDFFVRTILRANGLDPDRDANVYPA